MTTTVLYGELRTGKITGEIPATRASWSEISNGAGTIDSVVVPGDVVRALTLYEHAAEARTFLAVEQHGEIKQAGPIWLHDWNWEKQELALGATGLWGLFDYRKVLPVLAAGQYARDVTTIIADTDLGGIARDLVAQALTDVGGELPLILPSRQPGTRTETFPGWALLSLGDQLRQLTQRETAAPDIAFRPRRRLTDRRFIEWEMLVGTETIPQLAQVGGGDWVFDATAPKTPVLGIGCRGDGTVMASRAWVIGEGTDKGTVIGTDTDAFLTNRRWPLLETSERRNQVTVQATADGHATALLGRTSRRVQSWRVAVHTTAARQVRAGHYARVATAGDAYLPDGERRMRIRQITGDLTDRITMDMFPLQAGS